MRACGYLFDKQEALCSVFAGDFQKMKEFMGPMEQMFQDMEKQRQMMQGIL